MLALSPLKTSKTFLNPRIDFVTALLDVNALIALLDSEHMEHRTMRTWFQKHHHAGWSTCPLTENGMVRVLSQRTYPSGQRTPAEAIQALRALKARFAASHEFWPDDLSLSEENLFEIELLAGPAQITDAYLLALAKHHNGVLASFDRSLAWHAVRGGSESLVKHP